MSEQHICDEDVGTNHSIRVRILHNYFDVQQMFMQ